MASTSTSSSTRLFPTPAVGHAGGQPLAPVEAIGPAESLRWIKERLEQAEREGSRMPWAANQIRVLADVLRDRGEAGIANMVMQVGNGLTVQRDHLRVVHACEPLTKSIFLAGPTPEDQDARSWRPEALEILKRLGFRGTVFVPEPRIGDWTSDNSENQILWEWEGLAAATVVVFWIPRDLAGMPASTSNFEGGLMAAGKKLILGIPSKAPERDYLAALARQYAVPVYHTLADTMAAAVQLSRQPYEGPIRS
ncbi:MAG TPA: nucleoside 2-deoxyribosyltransferase domain-containing protein [Opitutaceae bacterium]|nr:nucleoside 2-deoxyribosyltransferase domain-containing protein [Opitutaceae bacterium]